MWLSNDAISDLTEELIAGGGKKPGLVDSSTPVPGSLKLEDDVQSVTKPEDRHVIDVGQFKGLNETEYQLARQVGERLIGTGNKGSRS